jgi:peptidoglycan/LPS O-acetylase OafA/YrhL
MAVRAGPERSPGAWRWAAALLAAAALAWLLLAGAEAPSDEPGVTVSATAAGGV